MDGEQPDLTADQVRARPGGKQLDGIEEHWVEIDGPLPPTPPQPIGQRHDPKITDQRRREAYCREEMQHRGLQICWPAE